MCIRDRYQRRVRGADCLQMAVVPGPATGFHGLTSCQKNEIHDIFALLDGNMDGLIGVSEVLFALQGALGEHDIDETEIRSWLQLISTDPNGEIDVYDLAQILASFEGPKDKTASAKKRLLDETFREMDKARKGSVSADTLQLLADKSGLKWSPAEAQEILAACDVDGNGRVDKADFYKVMKAAWEQPQEHWNDLKLEARAKIAARQAEIDRLQAQVDSCGEDEGHLGILR
eukprot:TRINITY_DN9509_c0_g2_i5.p2 TRINITY_DN9509_c0_g2~~TRINITY_DN9509_c0_g2_i5.p2  ORF type:complete len:231 (+),score=54.59 TRINITY_DN9509_c0_g2_i5:155-847(+)